MPSIVYASRSLCMMIALLLLSHGALQSREGSPPAGPPYQVGGDVLQPEKISGASPVYPKAAHKARVTGTVIIETLVDEQGNVTGTRVLKGLPMGLTEAAVEAVRSYKFKPATLDGKPVPVYYDLTIRFGAAPVECPRPDFGPHFEKYLEGRPNLRVLLEGRLYQEAVEYLDAVTRVARDPELQLARAYLFLEQDRVKSSWREAKAYRGPEPYEIFHRIGVAAWKQARDQARDRKTRAEVANVGIEAEIRALAEREGSFEAIAYKSLLLREVAQLASDPNESRELLAEADRLWDRALELQKEGKADGALDPAAREALSGSADGV